MNIKNGSGPHNVDHSLMSAHLMPPPEDSLNSQNSPQSSVEVGVTSIEAYERGYVAIDVQLFVSLLDGEDQRDFLRNSGKPSAARMKLESKRSIADIYNIYIYRHRDC
jgi:hypothetical protein